MEYSNEFQHLLLENEIYLEALQRSSVSVYSLGFEDFVLPGSKSSISSSNSSSSSFSRQKQYRKRKGKFLKAVIPNESQVYFLDRVEETLKDLQNQERLKERAASAQGKRSIAGYVSPSWSNNVGIEVPIQFGGEGGAAGGGKSANHSPTNQHHHHHYRPLSPTVAKLPSFGRPTNRIIQSMEEAKKYAELKEKEEAKKKQLSRKLSISQNGKEYVYDYSGYRIPVEEYENYKKMYRESLEKKEKEREERITQLYNLEIQPFHEEGKTKFTGAIVEKTSKYVENIRHQTEAERAVKPKPLESSFPLEEGEKVLPISHFYSFPEYLLIEKDDVIVTIEYCHSCEQHNWANHHIEEQYLTAATEIQDTLEIFMKDFPVRFFCVLKPIVDLVQVRLERAKSICILPNASPQLLMNPPPSLLPPTLPGINRSFSTATRVVGEESRVGAMEVQIMIHTGNERIPHILHSKLVSGNWPKIPVILSQLELLLPKYNYPRIRGSAYGIVRRKSTIDPNNMIPGQPQIRKRNTFISPPLSPDKQLEKLKKEITLIPSFDHRELRKVEVSHFFQKKEKEEEKKEAPVNNEITTASTLPEKDGLAFSNEVIGSAEQQKSINSTAPSSALSAEEVEPKLSSKVGDTDSPRKKATESVNPSASADENSAFSKPFGSLNELKHVNELNRVSAPVGSTFTPVAEVPSVESKIVKSNSPVPSNQKITPTKDLILVPTTPPSVASPVKASQQDRTKTPPSTEGRASNPNITELLSSLPIRRSSHSNVTASPRVTTEPTTTTSSPVRRNVTTATPPTASEDDNYSEFDEFEPVSMTNSPIKAKKSSGSIGIAEMQETNEQPPTRTSSGEPMESTHFEKLSLAVLDIKQMLLDDEYEDEQEGIPKSADSRGREDTEFWNKELYSQLGLNGDEPDEV